MRRIPAMVAAVIILVAAGSLNCSKKSNPPTAPPDQPAACSASATSLSFGDVTVGGSADRSFAVSNVGGGTLNGTASTVSAGYAVVAGASYTLGAGQQATVTVRFTPSAAGAQPGSVALSGTGCGPVACTANGVPAGPVCQVSTTALDFGTIPPSVCAYSTRTFTISNAGTGTLSGSVGSLHPAFEILGRTTYSLAPGNRDTITVRFSPTSFGDQRGRVTTGCDTVYVVGRTSGIAGCATLSTNNLDFGTIYVGQTVTKTFTLRAGGSPFDLAWAGDGNSNFTGPPAQNDVLPDDIISFPVHFTPQSAGSHSTWKRGECRYEIGDGQYHAFGCVRVTGSAVDAPGTPQCQLSATTLNFGTVPVGGSVDRTLTVTNIGGGVLNGTAAPSGCPEFTVTGDPTVSLGPGQSATYTIRFRPTQSGHAYTCYVFPFDPNCQVVTLNGQGN